MDIILWIPLGLVLVSVVIGTIIGICESRNSRQHWHTVYYCSNCNAEIDYNTAKYGEICPHCGVMCRGMFGLEYYRRSRKWDKDKKEWMEK